MDHTKNNIVFYDDDCIMCSRLIQWLLKKDKTQKLYFSALHSNYSKQVSSLNKIRSSNLDTIVFVSQENTYIYSEAVIRIVSKLGGAYKLIILLKIIPSFILNFIYKFIARNRKRIFTKQQSCELLTLDQESRILK